MSWRVWYRTYTDYLDVIPEVQAFTTIEEAEEFAHQYMTWHGEQKQQYIRAVEIQHIPCGEMRYYCECEEVA